MITAEITFSRSRLLSLKHPMEIVGVDWETYEEISEELGESNPLHLTFNKGNLTFVPVTELHEILTAFLHDFIRMAGMALRVNVISIRRGQNEAQFTVLSDFQDWLQNNK